MLDVKKIEPPSKLSEMAYHALKQSLLETDLSQMPQEGRLDERELAGRLGVSRTPLREAVNRLVVEGFLKVLPRKGIYVVGKSKKEILEILLVRAALEGMAARLAATYVKDKDIEKMKGIFSRFDPSNMKGQFLQYSDANIAFHELVLKISRCGKLIDMANSLFDHMRWIRFRAVTFEERLAQVHKEHLEIIKALEKKDPDLAEKRMRAHIEGLGSYIEHKVAFHH
ncbi:MAG: GntR family transcriptional regulator [Deltaproteobacteria bacterium]|nr:GntR family transcriptional regulator [Deltaproteobacteria bacterium]